MILKRIDSPEQIERRFQGSLHAAASLLGWVLPDNDEVVDATSNGNEGSFGELPLELQDSCAVFDRDHQNFSLPVKTCCDESEVREQRSSLNPQSNEVVSAD